MEKTNKPTCIVCGKRTVSIIETVQGPACCLCFTSKKEASEPKKGKRSISHDEDDMQAEFFKVVPIFFPNLPSKLLFAVPNGGKRDQVTRTNKKGITSIYSPEATRMKNQGVKSGVADVICLIPKKGFASLLIEFKTQTGEQSSEQKKFQEQAESCGSKYVIVRSVGRAIDVLKEYLK